MLKLAIRAAIASAPSGSVALGPPPVHWWNNAVAAEVWVTSATAAG
jgi:hypothetical protein